MVSKNTDAKESFRGYNLQVLRAVQRLFAGIKENKVIYSTIECGDDVYEINENESIQTFEQDKLYSCKGFSLNSEQIKKSVCIFLDKWLSMKKDVNIRFVFYTNVGISKENNIDGIVFPVIKILEGLSCVAINPDVWKIIGQNFISVIKKYYIYEYNAKMENKDAVNALKNSDWKEFACSIEWKFNSDDDIALRKNLKEDIIELCKKYYVFESFSDLILAAIERDIREGVCVKSFIDQLVSTDKVAKYFLEFSRYEVRKTFSLDDNWFQKSLDSSILLLRGRYSKELDIELCQEKFMKYISLNFTSEKISETDERKSEYNSLISEPFVVINGEAGIGKSHFIAHCARKYMQLYGKSILVLGQFCRSDNTLKNKILECIGINNSCNFNEFLQCLNNWGSILGKRSLIFLDAINEGKGIQDELEELIMTIKQYKYIGFIYSVRNKNSSLAIPSDITSITLEGLHTTDIEKFFEFYNIPMCYNYQDFDSFKFPLLLKTYCLAYNDKKYSPEVGLYSIFDIYFTYTNNRILKKLNSKCKANIVEIALKEYINEVLLNNDLFIDYETLVQNLEEKLKIYHINYNIVDELVEENIFAFYKYKESNKYQIFIEYELWGDYLLIKRILEIQQVKEYKIEEQLHSFFSTSNPYYNLLVNRIDMVAVLLPDIKCKYKDGGFEMFYWGPALESIDSLNIFLNSLYWRNLKCIHKVAYSIYINDFHVQQNNYDLLFDMWDCIMSQCIRSSGDYGIEFIYTMGFQLSDVEMQRVWTSYLDEKFFSSNIFQRLNYSVLKQYNYFENNLINNLIKIYIFFLYSLNEKIVNHSMINLSKLIKWNSKDIIYLLIHTNECCKDILVHIRLAQIIYNISDCLNIIDLQQIYDYFSFESLEFEEEVIYRDYFWFMYFVNGIGEFINLRTNKMMNKRMNYINKTILSDIDDDRINAYFREENDDNDDFVFRLDDDDDYCVLNYYKCQNEIVNAFKNNGNSDKFHFTTPYLIDKINYKYRSIFLKYMTDSIFKHGYSYGKFGFQDYNNYDNNIENYATKYEKIALNKTISSYLALMQRNGKSCEEDFLDTLTHFSTVDCSIPNIIEDYGWQNKSVENSLMDLHATLNNKEEWVPLTFGSFVNFNVQILNKNNSQISWNKILLENLFFNELYKTHHFFSKLKQETQGNELYFTYLWDYTPFLSLNLLHINFINENHLIIGDDKCSYYREGNLVCKNIIYEKGIDQLVILRQFLDELLISKKIVWRFIKDNEEIEVQL